MHIFVTGATGYIGTAVVKELVDAGHSVIGLTRSESGIEKLKSMGAEAHVGSLDDLDSLGRGAKLSDGVIHLAFNHNFSDFAGSLATDLKAIETIGSALEGTNKPFITTAHANGVASDNEVMSLARRGVRASIVDLSPSVHDEEKMGFVTYLINIAREKGFSAYVGDGTNHWSAIHRLDAAHLFRLAVENAPAGSRLLGSGDEAVQFYDIASTIARKLNIPLVSISSEDAGNHFGFLGALAGLDIPKPNSKTQELLNWKPTHPSIISDLEKGNY